MNKSLIIRLLGHVVIEVDGRPLSGLPSRAAEALLIYLVCHDQPVPRETLADLLWSERTQKQGLTNLRTILTGLRRELDDYLMITRQTLAFNYAATYRLDVAEFESQLNQLQPELQGITPLPPETAHRLQTAIDLYQGDFLATFSLREGPEFEAWVLLKREGLRRLAALGLRRLVAHYLSAHDYQEGLRQAERLLALDPYDDHSRRQMIWLLARSGQRNAALQHYQSYARLLADDLGVEPEPATTALFKRLQNLSLPPPHQLPPEPTPFVGRKTELVEIETTLSRPDCRLLSILGPGGMGKTRLALEIARRFVQQQPGRFLDGVYFAPLAPLPSADYLTTTLANLLGLTLQGSDAPDDQLLDHLRQREMLLILDNFEHLISPPSLDWLARILAQAPDIKLLITSRERLRLLEEQIFDMPGLAYPALDAVAQADLYDAVQMFLQHLRRIRPHFSPSEEDMTTIVKLCHLVDGMPLAIELAAGTGRNFSCQDIVAHLQKRFDALSDGLRNRPERHQNLRTVFEHSWSLLAEPEQMAARRLAVFQGLFEATAVEAITGATSQQLSLLVDKSFLQRRQKDLLELHPLIRQFLAEKLGLDPHEQQRIKTSHAHYYADLMIAATNNENMEKYYFNLLTRFKTDRDNVIAAATWLAEQHDFHARRLVTLLERLMWYFNWSHRYEEAKIIFRQLIQALQKYPDNSYNERWVTAVLRSRIAHADLSLHAYQPAQQQFETICPEAYNLENGALIAFCLQGLGFIAGQTGQFQQAFTQLEAAIEAVSTYPNHYRWPIYRTLADTALTAGELQRAKQIHDHAYNLALESQSQAEAAPIYKLALGNLLHRWGRLQEAHSQLSEALTLTRLKEEPANIALCLDRLAHILVDLGHHAQAQQYLVEGKTLANHLKDPRLLALLTQTYGWQAQTLADLDTARACYQHSLSIFDKIGRKIDLSFAQVYLGHIYSQLGEYEPANNHLQAAWQTFHTSAHQGGLALASAGLALLHNHQGQHETACQHFKAALTAALAGHELYFALQIVVELATFLAEAASPPLGPAGADPQETAFILLTFAQAHPALTAQHHTRLALLAPRLAARLNPAVALRARTLGQTKSLQDLLEQWL
jgi:predicted ATPase